MKKSNDCSRSKIGVFDKNPIHPYHVMSTQVYWVKLKDVGIIGFNLLSSQAVARMV